MPGRHRRPTAAAPLRSVLVRRGATVVGATAATLGVVLAPSAAADDAPPAGPDPVEMADMMSTMMDRHELAAQQHMDTMAEQAARMEAVSGGVVKSSAVAPS